MPGRPLKTSAGLKVESAWPEGMNVYLGVTQALLGVLHASLVVMPCLLERKLAQLATWTAALTSSPSSPAWQVWPGLRSARTHTGILVPDQGLPFPLSEPSQPLSL